VCLCFDRALGKAGAPHLGLPGALHNAARLDNAVEFEAAVLVHGGHDDIGRPAGAFVGRRVDAGREQRFELHARCLSSICDVCCWCFARVKREA
jgi:hypothetical protein